MYIHIFVSSCWHDATCMSYLVHDTVFCASIFILLLFYAYYYTNNTVYTCFSYSSYTVAPMICDVYFACFIPFVLDYSPQDLIYSYSSWSLSCASWSYYEYIIYLLATCHITDSCLPDIYYTLELDSHATMIWSPTLCFVYRW